MYSIPNEMIEANTHALPLSYNRCPFACYCVGILAVFIVCVLGVTGLGPIDDHHFIRTIFQGKEFGFYVMPELGRFFPLTVQEYVLASKIFFPSPLIFYSINALKLLICGGLLFQCLVLTKLGNLATSILWSVVIFSIGMANTLFRLSAGELNAFVLLLLFVWSSLFLIENSSATLNKKNAVAILGVVAFAVALFYKELIFVFGLFFGFSEYLRFQRKEKIKPPKFIFATILVGTSYILGYGYWRVFHTTGSYANFHSNSIINVLWLFSNSDPFLIFCVLPITACRIFAIIRDPGQHKLYDSFLIASCAYIAVYLSLAMYNTYYLLPAYAFAVIGVAIFLAELRSFKIRNTILFIALILGLNTFPTAVSDIQTQKETVNNHFQFVTFLSEWLVNNEIKADSQSRKLVLSGVSPGSGIEIIISLKTFLVSLGVPDGAIDVKGTEPSDNATISLFHGVKEADGYTAKVNDLLIFNPYQNIVTRPPLQSPSYQEIYRSSAEWTLPRWMGWQWIKLCFTNYRSFMASVIESMRYAGYSAFLVTRQSETVPPTALKLPAYRLFPQKLPSRMRSGTANHIEVMIANTGHETWPANGKLQNGKYVNLSYRWFDEGSAVALEGSRSAFPEPMHPNDRAKVSLRVNTPLKPGKYRLVIGPVQEGVCWFEGDKGKLTDVY